MTHRDQTQCKALDPSQATAFECDTLDGTGALDGSVAAMARFLRELVEMTGDSVGAHAAPVLELQFRDIFTCAALSTVQDAPSLTITALLPRLERAEFLPLALAQADMSATDANEWECLWHADAGHYVVVRSIPITKFADECSVMDAIADTADQAALWLARIS